MPLKTAFATFRADHPLRAMKVQPANDDQMIQMMPQDGLLDIEPGPSTLLEPFPEMQSEPRCNESAAEGRMLWVVGQDSMPVAIERGPWGRTLKSGEIKHSNLSGGRSAHSGGEMWRIKDQGLLINASSGRYGAESNEELDGVVEILRTMGFSVASMGFDIDNPTVPNRLAVTDLEWLAAYG